MFRPTKNNILVKISKEPNQTSSGIILVNELQIPVEAKVIAVGKLDIDIKPGDEILFNKPAGIEYKSGDDVFHILDEKYVMGIRKNKGFFNPPETGIYVVNLEKGEQKTKSGLLLMDDNMTERGIRPRWAQIWRVGKNWLHEFEPRQFILLEHGNWSPIFTMTNEGEKIDVQFIEDKSIRRGAIAVQNDVPDSLSEFGINPI